MDRKILCYAISFLIANLNDPEIIDDLNEKFGVQFDVNDWELSLERTLKNSTLG